MEESIKPVDSQPQTTIGEAPPAVITPQVPTTTFTKVDNNLTGIGFFTASSKRSRKAIEKTTVVIDQGVEHRISILPSAKYGLPITQDQDYWLALMKLVSEHVQREGKLSNPFAFTTAELRHILGQVNSGKNYKAVNEWLSVMNSTAIEGGSYNAARKTWYSEKTHAVDRVITIGKQLPDGTIADRNHIWFSQWQLDNINSGNLIAIELTTYTQLENNISKNLVPHLQEWLYASQRDGRFEKQYDDVCQLLGIRAYRYRSEIERNFGPSLDELTTHGYLTKWAIETMADRKHYKVVLWHGPKYHTDRKTRLEKKQRLESPAGESGALRRPRQRHLNLAPAPETEQDQPVIIDYSVVAELEKRGVGNKDARQLLATLLPGQPVREQLEHADFLIEVASRSRNPIQNAPGFYISHLRRNVPVPPTFETSQQKETRQQAILAQQEALRKHKEDAQAQEEAEEASSAARFNALAETDRLALLLEVKAEKLAIAPNMAHWFNTNPEADSFLLAGARKKLREGWTPKPNAPENESGSEEKIAQQGEEPHYAINSPIRQDATVQESAPVLTTDPEPDAALETTLISSFSARLASILNTPQLALVPVEQSPVEPDPAPTAPALSDHLL